MGTLGGKGLRIINEKQGSTAGEIHSSCVSIKIKKSEFAIRERHS